MQNPTITIQKTELLSNNHYILNKVTFDFKKSTEDSETQTREVYDRGNGAVILLYNTSQKTVILTRQFRLPTYLNNNTTGMLIEACAGMLDEDNPIDCIIRETEEETGYRLSTVKKIFQSYMSPGAVTEILHFFIGEYSPKMKISNGGGLEEEHEHIEVLEYSFDKAYQMIASGEITDAKTIMLLQYAKINLPL
ncbi:MULTISPECIES: NUDIX domain-containing protein [Flavobacterium]|uniref:GDP-mannose pyrophosphatase n=1 Tax=Flavobacterium keumense TaxID=1306518 RepID=A0ABY8N7W1_9FLAO|nr:MULTISPECIES: NUDIX domain-containing protein [Flavobacterium]WGK95732.1 NUDIX domain-containing protein [Flavobacterium keumense]